MCEHCNGASQKLKRDIEEFNRRVEEVSEERGLLNGLGGIRTPKPVSSFDQLAHELGEELDRLPIVINELAETLEPVLLNQAEKTDCIKEQRETGTRILDLLSATIIRVKEAKEALQDIKTRLVI